MQSSGRADQAQIQGPGNFERKRGRAEAGAGAVRTAVHADRLQNARICNLRRKKI